jgi:hypothetical protein
METSTAAGQKEKEKKVIHLYHTLVLKQTHIKATWQ